MSTLTALESITLEDAGSRAVIAPSRGGMATRFEVGDRPVMFLDAATLVDTTKNVRGGNPVLFPSPGPLAGDRFERAGKSGSMKQHGFARNRAWSVVATTSRETTLQLESDAETRAQYPWDFVARIRYALAGAALTIETSVENRSDSAMPYALGFHPYFHLLHADKKRASVPTEAKRAWDNVTKQMIDVTGPIDLTVKEVDLHLIDHGSSRATLDRGDDRIVLSGDPEFHRWVVWTLEGKDFVCLEPWTAAANALNTGESLTELAPGASKTMSVTISLER